MFQGCLRDVPGVKEYDFYNFLRIFLGGPGKLQEPQRAPKFPTKIWVYIYIYMYILIYRFLYWKSLTAWCRRTVDLRTTETNQNSSRWLSIALGWFFGAIWPFLCGRNERSLWTFKIIYFLIPEKESAGVPHRLVGVILNIRKVPMPSCFL